MQERRGYDNHELHANSEKIDSKHCRLCEGNELKIVLDYGSIPVADVLLKEKQLNDPPIVFPLTLAFCENCATLQLTDCVPMDVMYGDDYLYYSSKFETLIDHYGASAGLLIKKYGLHADSLVMEIASNDGYMLQAFKNKGIPVLGVDPAPGPANAAIQRGIPTVIEFFNKDLAERLRSKGYSPDLITANNLINLIPYPKDFVEGLSIIMKPDGHAVIEGNYMVNLISGCEFDMIFHSNLCYFSLTALSRLFRSQNLYINEVVETPVFGGSLRIFVGRKDEPEQSVKRMLEEEKSLGVDQYRYYKNFAERVEKKKEDVLKLLKNLKSENRRIAVYGAAGGMATTMMNYLGLDKQLVDIAVDGNNNKHGLYMPVNKIKIEPTDRLLEEMPEYTLILAWNYADEIIRQQKEYRDAGGKFIIPLPDLKII